VKQLLEQTENFETSRPVFRLSFERGDSTISANLGHPVYRYRPIAEEGNILSELVCDQYRESFNLHEGEFVVDKYDIASKAMDTIRSLMPTFLERNLGMKNNRQSKIYRWYYRNLPNDSDFNDTLVMVYKYMRSFCDESMRGSSPEHINNTIALLEAIMEKHEQN